jgi:hypothetical protein
MAPFAPSPSYEKRETFIGYYALWQWYDCNKLTDPVNIDFTKYTWINDTFFQPDSQGNLYRTDEWADPQLLFGLYLQNAATHTEDNKWCLWDRPGVQNCNHHDLSRGFLHLAAIAAADTIAPAHQPCKVGLGVAPLLFAPPHHLPAHS